MLSLGQMQGLRVWDPPSLQYTGPSQCSQGQGGRREEWRSSMAAQGALAANVYLLVFLLLPCCYSNIMNCSQVHQMRFRWSLGALLPKQAKLERADASGKMWSVSRSTKLEMNEGQCFHLAWWPSEQWDLDPVNSACQEVLSAFTVVGLECTGSVS